MSLFGLGTITFWLALLVFGVALVALPFIIGAITRAHRRRAARRAAYVVPVWPALVPTTPTPWDQIRFWSGWHERLPGLRATMILFFTFSIFAFLLFGFIVGMLFVVVLTLFGFSIMGKAKREQQKFVRQLPEGLQSLVDTLRAGYSLPQAVVFLAREATPPLQSVFAALVRAQEMDLPFPEALQRIAVQLQVRDWTMVAETLVVQQRLGGNIIPFLEETSRAVRDRILVEGDIKTMTAAGRMSGFMIAGMVPVVVLFFFLLAPAYIQPLFETTLGRILFGGAIGLEIIGFLWVRKITSIDL